MKATLVSTLEFLGTACRPHLHDIAIGVVATLLVIYGDDINRLVKRNVAKKNLLIRMTSFIALCSVGYTLLTVHLTRWLEGVLANFQPRTIPIVILGVFILLSYLAQRKDQV
jgi:undecaprenyl pyrophosphate phosphatase UppP